MSFDPPASELRAELVLGGGRYRLLELDIDQSLGAPGGGWVVLAAAAAGDPRRWLGAAVRVELSDWQGQVHCPFAGEVIAATEPEASRAGTEGGLRLKLAPRLGRLAESCATRVYPRLTLEGFIEGLLAGHGLGSSDWRLALGQAYPQWHGVLQAGESDLDFLLRRLAAAGAYSFVEPGPAGDVAVIADHNAAGGHAGVVSYRPGSGLGTAAVGEAWELWACAAAPAPAVGRHVLARPPAARSSLRPREARANRRHRPPAPDAETAETEARWEGEAAACRREWVTVNGLLPGLRPGVSVALQAPGHPGAVDGDYLVTRVRQRLGAEAPGAGGWRTEAEFSALERPWRPEPPPLPELPALLGARIEADLPGRALLDGEGAYRARIHADATEHPPTEASAGLPLLTPYASPTAAPDPAGWHFPLQPGSEVLLTCLDGDPDRACLVGFAPAAGQEGPVNGDHPGANELLTPGGNRLVLGDEREAEAVVLETFDGQCLLRLDARSEAPFVRLACQQGAARARAGGDLRLACGGDLAEQAGAGRSERVGGSQRSTTAGGHLRREARQGSVGLGAADGAELRAGGDLQLRAGARLVLQAEAGAELTVDGGAGLELAVRQGAFHASAARGIEIRGDGGGDIVFEHNGAGFAVLADGTVRLFGRAVSLHAGTGEVALNGPVHYHLPEPPQPSRAEPAAPPAIEALPELPDPHSGVLGAPRLTQPRQPLCGAQGEALPELRVSYTTRGYDPERGPVHLTLWRESEGARTLLCEAEHRPAHPDGGHRAALPAPALGGAAALVPVTGRSPEAISLTAAWAEESRDSDSPGLLLRPLGLRLTERAAGAPPLAGATLYLEDTTGAIHTARVHDGRAQLEQVPVGRLRLWAEDAAGASLALVGANGLPLPPGARPWLRERELAQIATELQLIALPPPVVINLRAPGDPDAPAEPRHRLSPEELDYFRRQGANATVFIHGYNAPLGAFGPALQADPPAPGGPHPYARGRGTPHTPPPTAILAAAKGEAPGYVDPAALRAAFPGLDWRHAALRPFTAPETLNGQGALAWLCAMEGVLNRAAAGGPIDYSRYQRLIGVTWSGNTAAHAFWDAELNAGAAGRRLLPLLLQLHDAGIKVNLICHSLGARVALTALNALAEARPAPVVEQCFLWQPAVAEHALTDDPDRDPSPLAHEHFPAAYRAARRIVVLHTAHDGVLGPRPEGQPDEADDPIEDAAEEFGGAYPHKYRLDGHLRQRYFPGVGGRIHSRAIRARLIEGLETRLRREAELAQPTERQHRGEAPLYPLELLAPWAREYRFDPDELSRITTGLQDLLDERLSVPNEVAPAMGWGGPLVLEGTIEEQMFLEGRLEIINQGDLLTTHSGMKWPSERLFEEIIRREIMKRILENTGFGTYT